jgi:hypothetical protein
MAEAQDQPDEGQDATPPPGPPPPEQAAAEKQPAKKAPAKKTVKKTPAKKAPAKATGATPAKKAPPRKAPAKKVAPPAEPPTPAELVTSNGSPPVTEGAREAAAAAKSSVEQAPNPVSPAALPAPQSGRSPLPFAIAFAVAVLIALLVRRMRHRQTE